MHQPERRLLTVSEVAEATGLSSNAVYRAIAVGELRASKLRGRLRVQLADLDAWIRTSSARAESTTCSLCRPNFFGLAASVRACASCWRPMAESPLHRADCAHADSHSEGR